MGIWVTWGAVASASADVARGPRSARDARDAAERRVSTGRWERVVLIGLMGSGKSTVGRLLAGRLHWTFVDLDEQVEASTGTTVEELFQSRGEAAFRSLEAEAGAAALARAHTVLAPGGGWSLAPGRLGGLPDGTLTVWLRVSPETAARRATGHGRVRPLLGGTDPVGRARALLAEREATYRGAALHLDSEHASPAALAQAIVDFMSGPRTEPEVDA